MYEFLLVLAVLVFFALKYRETFIVKYGNPFNNEDIVSFDMKAKGKRLFAITPDTCPGGKPDMQGGLCYAECDAEYDGSVTRCNARTSGIGIGLVQKLLSCEESGYPGRTDDGLLCRAPITWNSCKFRGLFNECWGGAEGGQIDTKKLTCAGYPAHTDMVDGLCYRKCPTDKPNRVPGQPYLCYAGNRGVSYDRGAGDVPGLWLGPE
jgi:hypothetical protein